MVLLIKDFLITRSINRDLLLGLIPTIILVGLLLGAINYQITAKREIQLLQNQAEELTENLARVTANPIFLSESNVISSVLREYMKGPYIVEVGVFDEENNRSYMDTHDTFGPTLTIERPITMFEKKLGSVKMVFTMNHITTRQNQMFRYTLIVIFCYIIVVGIVVVVLLRLLLRKPIKKLIDNIRTISDGSYEKKLGPIKHQYIGMIAYEVNAMVDKISNREQQMLAYQEKLRSLTKEMLLAEERERRHIATDLHDRIGHALTNVAIKTALLKDFVTHAEAEQLLVEMKELVEQSAQDVRSMIFEISPPVLYDLGLIAALDWLSEHATKEHGLSVTFRHELELNELGISLQVLVFHAVRELLFNVRKHARANKVEISVFRDADMLCISVEDDGIGMSKIQTVDQNNLEGFGLFNIRERLSHLNGCLKTSSETGKGTRVVIEIPEN